MQLFAMNGAARARRATRVVVCAVPRGDAYSIHQVTIRGTCVAAIEDVALGTEPRPRHGKGFSKHVQPRIEVALVLPRRDVHIRYIRVPTKNSQEIARMAPYEASLHSPWPIAEIVVGYEKQFGDDEGYTTVAVYIARSPVVEDHIERLRESGLVVTRVEPSTRCFAELLRAGADPERPALLAMNEDGGEFVRLSNGHHEFSRGAGIEEDAEKMLARCLDLDAKQHGRFEGCTSLYTVGTDSEPLRDLVSLPEERVCRIETLRLGAWDERPALSAGSALAVGAALAVTGGDGTSSLLPHEHSRALHRRGLISHARRLAILLAWFGLSIGATVYLLHTLELRRALRAEREIEVLRPEAGDLQSQSRALKMLARDRLDATLPLQLVLDLYDRTPQDIAISSFRYDSRGGVTLGGETQQFPSIYKFLESLKQSKLLREIRLTNSAKPRSGQNSIVEFKITARIAGND